MVKHETSDISAEGQDVKVSRLRTVGEPENHVERIHLYAYDAAVRAMQALRDDRHPDDCEGLGLAFSWPSGSPALLGLTDQEIEAALAEIERIEDAARERFTDTDGYVCDHCGMEFLAADYDGGMKGAQAALAGHAKRHTGEVADGE